MLLSPKNPVTVKNLYNRVLLLKYEYPYKCHLYKYKKEIYKPV